jgi:hypothetical protein
MAVGDLIRHRGHGSLNRPRTAQPATHSARIRPSSVIRPVSGTGGGHTTWTCRTCDETVDGPPLNTHCTTLDGPATVRISTRHS